MGRFHRGQTLAQAIERPRTSAPPLLCAPTSARCPCGVTHCLRPTIALRRFARDLESAVAIARQVNGATAGAFLL